MGQQLIFSPLTFFKTFLSPEEVPVVLLLLDIIAKMDFNRRRILAVCGKLAADDLTMMLPALMMMVEALMHASPVGSDAYRRAMRYILGRKASGAPVPRPRFLVVNSSTSAGQLLFFPFFLSQTLLLLPLDHLEHVLVLAILTSQGMSSFSTGFQISRCQLV